jgi:hypothetical protein
MQAAMCIADKIERIANQRQVEHNHNGPMRTHKLEVVFFGFLGHGNVVFIYFGE